MEKAEKAVLTAMQAANQKVADTKKTASRRRKNGWSERTRNLTKTRNVMLKAEAKWRRGHSKEDITKFCKDAEGRWHMRLDTPQPEDTVNTWSKWALGLREKAAVVRRSLHGADRRREREYMMRNNKHKEQGWREAQGKYIDKVLGRPQRSAGITEVVQTVEGQQKWVGGKKANNKQFCKT